MSRIANGEKPSRSPEIGLLGTPARPTQIAEVVRYIAERCDETDVREILNYLKERAPSVERRLKCAWEKQVENFIRLNLHEVEAANPYGTIRSYKESVAHLLLDHSIERIIAAFPLPVLVEPRVPLETLIARLDCSTKFLEGPIEDIKCDARNPYWILVRNLGEFSWMDLRIDPRKPCDAMTSQDRGLNVREALSMLIHYSHLRSVCFSVLCTESLTPVVENAPRKGARTFPSIVWEQSRRQPPEIRQLRSGGNFTIFTRHASHWSK